MLVRFLVLVGSILSIIACSDSNENGYIPKPKGYNRIDLAPHIYQTLEEKHPYRFEHSQSARILPDSFAPNEPHWIFIDYPQHKANIQLTYKRVKNNPALLGEYINDSYKLSGKHQIKATAIQEQVLKTTTGKTVTIIRLLGDVPSPYQFFVTDSTENFLRGAIYFPVSDKADSIAPVTEYLYKDMLQLVNTLEWVKR